MLDLEINTDLKHGEEGGPDDESPNAVRKMDSYRGRVNRDIYGNYSKLQAMLHGDGGGDDIASGKKAKGQYRGTAGSSQPGSPKHGKTPKSTSSSHVQRKSALAGSDGDNRASRRSRKSRKSYRHDPNTAASLSDSHTNSHMAGRNRGGRGSLKVDIRRKEVVRTGKEVLHFSSMGSSTDEFSVENIAKRKSRQNAMRTEGGGVGSSAWGASRYSASSSMSCPVHAKRGSVGGSPGGAAVTKQRSRRSGAAVTKQKSGDKSSSSAGKERSHNIRRPTRLFYEQNTPME